MEYLFLAAIPLLIAINALFVAVEYALVSIRKTRVEEMIQQGLPGAKAIARAREQMDRSIAATQLGVTVASIALGAIGEPALAELLHPAFFFMPEKAEWLSRHGCAATISLFLITMFHVILGEQVPKIATFQSADKVALALTPALNVFVRITEPITRFMNWLGNHLLRALGYNLKDRIGHIHSVKELKMLVDETEGAGLIDPESADYVQNAFELRDKKVRECMVPREKIDALELHTPSDKILEFVRSCGHTRIPVYDGSLDSIIGILNTKNLFYFFSLMHVVILDDALYPATFLKSDDSIAQALRHFKRTKVPMSLVRDEEQKLIGMITLEDILEEIVGDIEDEHDGPTTRLIRLPRKVSESGVNRQKKF